MANDPSLEHNPADLIIRAIIFGVRLTPFFVLGRRYVPIDI
jgi:hypothetical protein